MGLAKELRSRRKLTAREVLVPEWGDDSGAFKLYCRSITCYDLDQLQKKHPDFLSNTTIGSMVDLICMKAEDEGGNKLFGSAEDRMDLMGEETAGVCRGGSKKLKADSFRMNLLSLADRLHLTIAEAEAMPVNHFYEWLAYFQIMSESDG
jgi:hypothetical protein